MLKKLISTCKDWGGDSFRLLWKFKWYILPYALFYFYLLTNYLFPCAKNHFIWRDEIWGDYGRMAYMKSTELLLIIFALLFLVGTSNMHNHPRIAKLIFLSSLWFWMIFLDIIWG